MTALITFDHATLGYGRRVVLSDISFDIPAGDFLGLVGPNGAGKTTILRAILGSLAPISGTVVKAPGLRFGYVPQRDSVDYNFPLKVLDVVMMGRYDRIGLMRRPSNDDRSRARKPRRRLIQSRQGHVHGPVDPPGLPFPLGSDVDQQRRVGRGELLGERRGGEP